MQEVLFATSSIDVPLDLIVTLLPAASSIISPLESNVISVPSLVIVSKAIDPTFVTLLSLKLVAPRDIVPVAVRLSEPISMFPNPEVIEPLFNAPVDVKLGIAVISSSR